MPTPSEFTAAEAVRLLGSGALSAVELARFYLDRIERIDPTLHSVLALAPDALDAAGASDQRRADGRLLGPLDGVPILIKDNIEAVGLPGTAGSRALLNSPVVADAPLVSRLRAAGLVLLGSTNLSEWANFRSTASTSGWSAVGGQTGNPHDPSRNPSGSSAGSAAAVGAGLAPLSVGTETDGSIVSPAGMCGVVGFKPTIGTVPGSGIVPISPVQDIAGPMARTVADADALYAVLADHPGDAAPVDAAPLDAAPVDAAPVERAPVELAGRRIAWWTQDNLPEAVDAVLQRVRELLVAAGAIVVPTSVPASSNEPSSPFSDAEFDALVTEFAVALPAYLAVRPGDHPRTWEELLAFNRADEVELSRFSDEIFQLCPDALDAGGLDSADYRTARETCSSSAEQALASVLADCDFAIAPTNGPAGAISYGNTEHEGVLTSSLCAVTGAPSITIPAAGAGGLPIGISLLGRRGTDMELLAFAAAVERALPAAVFPALG